MLALSWSLEKHKGIDRKTSRNFVLDFHKFKGHDDKTLLEEVRKGVNGMLK